MRELEELGRTISADPPIPPLPISEIEARAGRHRTRPRALAVGVVVVVLAVSAGLLAAIRPTTHPQHRRGSERGHSRTWVTRLEVGEALGVAADNQTVWVAGVNVVRRIDPIRNAITATIAVPGTSDLRSVSLAFGSVWVTDTGTQRVTRVDPASNRVVATIPVGGSPTGTAGAGGLLWVAIPNPNTPGISFAPVDPFTNAVGEPITLTRGGPDPFPTLTSDGPQVVIEWAQRVWVLDPRARTVLPFGPPGLRGVYAAGADQDGVLAIDQRSRVVRLDHDRIGQIGAVVPGGLALTTDPTSVWVLARKNARSDPQLVRLDHRTLRPVGRPTTLPSFWSGAAAQYNRVWVGVDGELVRVDTRPRPTRPDLCPSAAPIEYWGADGLPPEERVTTDPDAESQELSRESERLERRYPTATDFTIGPGYGRAWSRETGRVVVSAVEDAAIIVHFPGRRACPKGNGPPIGVPTARNMPVLLAADGTGAPGVAAISRAQLRQPGSLAVNSRDKLLVCDHGRVLQRLDSGAFVRIAGTGRPGFSTDGTPALDADLDCAGFAAAPDGTLYFTSGALIRAVTPQGRVQTVAGDGSLHEPDQPGTEPTPALDTATPGARGLTVAPNGDLWFADDIGIRFLDDAGMIHTWKTAGFGEVQLDRKPANFSPSRIAFDTDGTIWVYNDAPKMLIHYDRQGAILGQWDRYLAQILPDPNGGLIVADYGSFAVEHVSASGAVTTLVPSNPGVGLRAFRPESVAVTADGTLYASSDQIADPPQYGILVRRGTSIDRVR